MRKVACVQTRTEEDMGYVKKAIDWAEGGKAKWDSQRNPVTRWVELNNLTAEEIDRWPRVDAVWSSLVTVDGEG